MLGVNLPKITCTLVTTGRVELVKKSIQYYLNQTYPHRNLVILSQGSKDDNKQIEEYISALNRTDILFLKAPASLSLGALRNTSVELATGEIICQWDDDDIYHPDRIMTQYTCLRADSRNSAAIYCDFLKYFKTTSQLYWCDWSGEPLPTHKFLCGSAMFYKKFFHMFHMFYPESGPQSQVEEDLNVLEKLSWKGRIAPVHAGHQYIYVYHGENTYNLDHHLLTLDTQWGKKVMDSPELLANKELLESTFHLAVIDEEINVCSIDGTIFTYKPNGEDFEV